MADRNRSLRSRARIDTQPTRQQAIVRRVALAVAALLVAALIGPFVVDYVAG